MSKHQLLLLVMLFGMIIATFFAQRSAVAYFSAEGSGPLTTAVSVVAVVAFGVGALVIHRRRARDES